MYEEVLTLEKSNDVRSNSKYYLLEDSYISLATSGLDHYKS